MIDPSNNILEFIENIDELNIFHNDGTASSSTCSDPRFRSYVSYIGQFINEDLSMEFKYFLDDNTYQVTFHTWEGIDQIDLTNEYINSERMQSIITTLKEFAEKYFT